MSIWGTGTIEVPLSSYVKLGTEDNPTSDDEKVEMASYLHQNKDDESDSVSKTQESKKNSVHIGNHSKSAVLCPCHPVIQIR